MSTVEDLLSTKKVLVAKYGLRSLKGRPTGRSVKTVEDSQRGLDRVGSVRVRTSKSGIQEE